MGGLVRTTLLLVAGGIIGFSFAYQAWRLQRLTNCLDRMVDVVDGLTEIIDEMLDIQYQEHVDDVFDSITDNLE